MHQTEALEKLNFSPSIKNVCFCTASFFFVMPFGKLFEVVLRMTVLSTNKCSEQEMV